MAGLLFYDIFPARITLKNSPLLAPKIVIRVVTRGNFPDLVRNNVERNLNTCYRVGLDNFYIEIVTDKPINLAGLSPNIVREIVVPTDYRTNTGALFKARALQYALESNTDGLFSDGYIVHLDEETLMTEDSIRGILNFVDSNEYDIGQGLITYANEKIVNIWTTLADSIRVGLDLGSLRFCLKKFNQPLFSIKGSFLVCRAACELELTFDHGLVGSITEDIYFAMRAISVGKKFDWIEGEMWEKSPFTFGDFIKQRKRWLQGISLIVHDRSLSWHARFYLGIGFYSSVTMPLALLNIVLVPLYPVPLYWPLKFMIGLIGGASSYLYVIGALRSFSLARLGFTRFTIRVIGAVATMPVAIMCEAIAVVWALFGNNREFHIVNKAIDV